jgi:hypothetical protein
MVRLSRRAVLSTMAGVPALGVLGCFGPRGNETREDGTKAAGTPKVPRYRGVVYDVGLNYSGKGFSVAPFDPKLVEHDIRVIANDLHANAVRIEGEEIPRLVTAARAARAAGLTVFFNPWKMNVGPDQTRAYLVEAARAAEQLRKDGVDIVFVAGCEYTIFNPGVFPGETLADRLSWLSAQFAGAGHQPGQVPDAFREKSVKLNEILRSFATAVRGTFGGPLTYAAGSWEAVDWGAFDSVGVDYYRDVQTDEQYVAGLQRYRSAGKPLVVTEVGCCTYEGAAVRGAGGFMIFKGVNPDGSGIFEGGVVPARSEREQADYVETQLNLLARAGVDGVFVFVFSFPTFRTGEGANDLDRVSFALVKTFPDQDPRSKAMPPWAPKESFRRVADVYRRMTEGRSR